MATAVYPFMVSVPSLDPLELKHVYSVHPVCKLTKVSPAYFVCMLMITGQHKKYETKTKSRWPKVLRLGSFGMKVNPKPTHSDIHNQIRSILKLSQR